MRKLISRVARPRSGQERLEGAEDSDLAGLEGMDDPRQAREFARRMGREFGGELGEDFEDEMEAAMAEGEGGEGGENGDEDVSDFD